MLKFKICKSLYCRHICLGFEFCCGCLQPAIHNISLPKQSTVGDVLTEIKKTVIVTFDFD